jgi:hypothetical protein
MPGGCKFAVRDLRIFGYPNCNAPGGIPSFAVTRNATDKRMATVTWTKVADAEGYIIRLGNAPNKLYNNYQVLSKDTASCVIRSLNVGVTYYFAMDAYGSCGLTKGTLVKRDDNVTSIESPVLRQSVATGKGAFRIIGNRFDVPREFTGKSYQALVYDLSGRLLYRSIVKNGTPDVRKNSLGGNGAYIVIVKTLQDGATSDIR